MPDAEHQQGHREGDVDQEPAVEEEVEFALDVELTTFVAESFKIVEKIV